MGWFISRPFLICPPAMVCNSSVWPTHRRQAADLLPEVKSRRIPVYSSLEALLAKVHPDLVVLSTPPQLHAEQAILALDHGCHVLCEKPVACDPQQVKQMIQARAPHKNRWQSDTSGRSRRPFCG